ncbi:MAG: winged helix-turn-helix domain-containing protein [Bryobacteraceae bacterium]|jgi:DNA-binding winged helix-turn-helix (wHTH) protein/Tol biopolymer transport system component
MQDERNGRVLQFGAFELETGTGEIRKHGTRIRLQGKPLQILQALLDRPGGVVTREELRDRLWAADTFVDFESGLNTAVNRLRLALGDSADRPRYVETLARSGYRFVAMVSESHPTALEEKLEENGAPAPPAFLPAAEPPRRSSRAWLAAAAIAILANLAGWVIVGRPRTAPLPTFHQITFGRTTIAGARFGPDGQNVIYDGQTVPGDRELYLANTVSPESRPLGFPRAMLASVSRSGELALLFSGGPRSERSLVRVPMNGGAPLSIDLGIWSADWAPDSSRMAVLRYGPHPESIEYPRNKTLYESTGWLSDVRVSPSGNEVAFMEHLVMGDDAGSVVAIDGKGARRTLSAGWASAQGLAWSPSGREIWFTAARTGVTRALYAASLSGKVRLVAAFPGILTLHDISASGRVLISREQLRAMMTALVDGSPKEKDLSWFDYTTAEAISADGRVVLFDETGEGGGIHHTVYIRRANAPSAIRVGEGYGMAVSPDGNWAILKSDRDQTTLNLVPLTPGQPRSISGHNLRYDFVRFFPGGDRLLVGGSLAGARPRFFVQALDGSAPRPLGTSAYFMRPAISQDGKQIAGVDGERRLLVLSAAGGEPKVIATGFAPTVLRWSHSGKALLAQGDSVPAMLYSVDVETGKSKPWKEIAPLDLANVSRIWPAFLSQDEHTIVYSYPRILSELFVVDGWR